MPLHVSAWQFEFLLARHNSLSRGRDIHPSIIRDERNIKLPLGLINFAKHHDDGCGIGGISPPILQHLDGDE
jgi:hypothetical protein